MRLTRRPRLTSTLRGGLAAGCGVGLVLVVAAPGWAHVTITPTTAERGGDAVLGFVVPTESDSASTVKVQVFMPEGHPIASVSVRPHPGWQAKVSMQKLSQPLSSDDGKVTRAVSSVTWTPDSPQDAVKPGEYDEFDLAVGPLPSVSSLTFKTLQTYSDGSVVRWIDAPAPAGHPEPAHPAPMLTLVAAGDAPAGSAGSAASGSGSGRANVALALSVLALLVAAGTAVRSGMAARRRPG